MTVLALVHFGCSLVLLTLASALIARDPGLRVNRLLGGVVLAIAYWGLCHGLWTLEDDAGTAKWLVRFSSMGWMSLGPLCFHTFVEVGSRRRARLRRWVRVSYGISMLGMLAYIATPWCLEDVVPTPWGWGYRFGFLFPVAYLSSAVPAFLVLLNWRQINASQGSWGERRVARTLYGGVVIGVVAGTIFDAVLPALGFQLPSVAIPVLSGTVIAAAVNLNRFGFSMLSSSAFAQEVLDTLSAGVVLLRPDGRIRDANLAMAHLVGEPPAALRDRPVAELFPELVGERRRPVELLDVESRLLDVHGEAIPVLLSSCVVEREGGRLLGAALVVRDLREVAGLRERLVTSSRLAAVGELSAGIAHEISDPIAAVRRALGELRAEWARLGEETRRDLAENLGEDPTDEVAELVAEGEELIDESLEGVDRVSAIVRDVAGLADDAKAELEAVDVVGLVQAALRLTRAGSEPGVRVLTELDPVPAVEGVPQQLEQVLVNLIQNALHAVGERGVIGVATRVRDGGVVIRVEDDGHGIPPEVCERIFDPFFTTKPVGEGTGLGLAISYRIIRNHGGELRAESRPGAGAVFWVELPQSGRGGP